MGKKKNEHSNENKTKKPAAKKRTSAKPTNEDNAAIDIASNEVMQTNESFLGINKKSFLFVFVGIQICLLFEIFSFFEVMSNVVPLFSYIFLYIFGVASFVRVNRPLMSIKSIFDMICRWFIWTVGFILVSLIWIRFIWLLGKQLNLFYEAFPIFCGKDLGCVIKADRNFPSAIILLLSSSFLSIYFYKKLVAKFSHLIFTKTILSFLLSMLVSFVLLLSFQYTLKKISGVTFCISDYSCGHGLMKPIIYLYPTETTNVSVKLGAPEKLTHTYPKYINEWKVWAEPNGNLTDEVTGRSYYSLYWEGKDADLPQYNDGFVVSKENVVPFLEEKLAHLGLNEREANEFIIYWLPKLESAPYAFIHFVSQEEQNKNMPLTIQPKPNKIIRVLMAFKCLDKPIVVKEQILPKMPERYGFTVIEWGGTEISSGLIK